ncbi:MAG TPA: fatty acid--CoA ligase [Deltaproteobacteria bacterium]|nr:fatty acid--CoA ligase [Candidatus Binatota bacterium]HIL14002.1 fatty acid--CoA ligase [Deltaproteobacteria bacterium]
MDLEQQTIPGLVQAAAGRWGDSVAVEDNADGEITYRRLADDMMVASRAFIAAGVNKGDRVAVWAPNSYRWIAAALGLQAAGAVLVTLNTRLKGGEAGYILANSGARVLLTVNGFLGTDYTALLVDALDGAARDGGEEGTRRPVAGLPALERVLLLDGPPTPGADGWQDFLAGADGVSEQQARERLDELGGDDLSDLLFTSGTTGKPKGVMTAHGQNLRAFESWSEVVGLREGDRYLVVNPFFHSFGYKAGWLASFMRGATVLPETVFDVARVLERIERDRVSMLPGPPTLYQGLLSHPGLAQHDLSSLRLAVTGAAVIPVELVERMRDELGFDTVITGYGLTETCGIVTMCRFDDDPETIATTSGRAIPGVDVMCVGRMGDELPRGEPGEVVVRGYNVMRGYFDDPAATDETITNGWLHTGDVGVMDERGYLKITDRMKDMFIMGGFNCYPAEIENLMAANADLAQVAVVGVPDERMGEVGVAFVVLAEGSDLTSEAVVAWCRENMANYKVPRRVELVGDLPMNASGKVVKYQLRERVAGLR